MKILYISTNKNNPPVEPLVDYQNDCLLIGLKELFGDDVVDYQRRDHLYTDFSVEEAKKQYGKGFTVTRVLEPDNADRTDIEKKIKNKFFDLVIYGSVSRCIDMVDLVLEHYPKHKIIFVDGDDNPKFNRAIKYGTPYFKRELIWENNEEYQDYFGNVAPISFAFPTSKVQGPKEKTQLYAINDPRKPKSYVFENEQSYYEDYQKSKYAFTVKKAGWDCLRHYEIMANGCIPLFENFPQCPRYVMVKFPKALITRIGFFYKSDFKYLENNYDYFLSEVMKHLNTYNTTKAMAENFIDEMNIYIKHSQSNK